MTDPQPAAGAGGPIVHARGYGRTADESIDRSDRHGPLYSPVRRRFGGEKGLSDGFSEKVEEPGRRRRRRSGRRHRSCDIAGQILCVRHRTALHHDDVQPSPDRRTGYPAIPTEELIEGMDLIPEPAVLFLPGGRIAAINSATAQLAGIPVTGMTVADALGRYGGRRSDGSPIIRGDLPCARALRGEIVEQGERLDLDPPRRLPVSGLGDLGSRVRRREGGGRALGPARLRRVRPGTHPVVAGCGPARRRVMTVRARASPARPFPRPRMDCWQAARSSASSCHQTVSRTSSGPSATRPSYNRTSRPK